MQANSKRYRSMCESHIFCYLNQRSFVVLSDKIISNSGTIHDKIMQPNWASSRQSQFSQSHLKAIKEMRSGKFD